MSKQLELKVPLSILVDFDFQKERPEQFKGEYGNYLPGDPATIKNLRVSLQHIGKTIDITKFLDKNEIAAIESEIWDNIECT